MKGIREEIHPEFYDAFEDFRKKFKKAMKTYSPANDNFLLDELNYLSDEVKRTNGEYNVRVWAAIIDQAESGDLGLAA